MCRFAGEVTRRGPDGVKARALFGLCDRDYLLTRILGPADMMWHGDPGQERQQPGGTLTPVRTRAANARPRRSLLRRASAQAPEARDLAVRPDDRRELEVRAESQRG